MISRNRIVRAFLIEEQKIAKIVIKKQKAQGTVNELILNYDIYCFVFLFCFVCINVKIVYIHFAIVIFFKKLFLKKKNSSIKEKVEATEKIACRRQSQSMLLLLLFVYCNMLSNTISQPFFFCTHQAAKAKQASEKPQKGSKAAKKAAPQKRRV